MPTARQLAMLAAYSAAVLAEEQLTKPAVLGRFLEMPGLDRLDELTRILDDSPQLPASAAVPFLFTAMQIDPHETSAEAFKATWLGMKPWIAAEEKRLAEAEEEARRAGLEKRKSPFEKTGRQEPVGAKIYSEAEQRRIAEARAASDPHAAPHERTGSEADRPDSWR